MGCLLEPTISLLLRSFTLRHTHVTRCNQKTSHKTSPFVRMSVSRRVHFHHFIHQLSGFVDLKQLKTSSEKDRLQTWHDNILVLDKVIIFSSFTFCLRKTCKLPSGTNIKALQHKPFIVSLGRRVVGKLSRKMRAFPETTNNSKLRKEKVATLGDFFGRNPKKKNFVRSDARFERKKWVCLLCFF